MGDESSEEIEVRRLEGTNGANDLSQTRCRFCSDAFLERRRVGNDKWVVLAVIITEVHGAKGIAYISL